MITAGERMLSRAVALFVLLGSALVASADDPVPQHVGQECLAWVPSGMFPLHVMGEFDGKALKWIKIAEPLLAKAWLLDKDDRVIAVSEDNAAVYVTATTRERLNANTMGGPGYVVEISKADMRILSAHGLK